MKDSEDVHKRRYLSAEQVAEVSGFGIDITRELILPFVKHIQLRRHGEKIKKVVWDRIDLDEFLDKQKEI